MKKSFKLAVAMSAMLAGSFLMMTNTKQVSAKSYSKAITKIAGQGNYPIYHRVSGKGPSGKFTSTRYFKYGQIQSKQSASTKKGTFWKIIVDGRTIGWVSESFFARNQISVASDVSLVKDGDSSFPTRDAINFVTDSHGTAVDPAKVTVSKAYVSSPTTVNYSYGKANASVKIDTRTDPEPSQDARAQKGFKSTTTWNGGSKGSSRNWNAAHHYRSETSSSFYRGNGMTLRTRLFEPRFISLGYGQAGDKMGQVGVIPEGITVNNGVFVTSMFAQNNSQYGHLVSYNLNAMPSKYAAQNLTTMRWSTFKHYARNIKVSPYIKLGHGQSLGSSSSYIYVLANDNSYTNGDKAEEILQIRKSDMKINKIWTVHVAEDRYIHNATFVGDDTMYALFHNAGHNQYEYWRLTRNGDQWKSTQIGITKGNMVTNSPVQGFTYGNGHFYIGYNDNIFKVSDNGAAENHYHFNTRREIEGLAFAGNKLYVGLAQRAELLTAR